MIDVVSSPETLSSFILATKTNRLDICDKVIDFWKESTNKTPGIVYGKQGVIVDPEYKDSLDVGITYEPWNTTANVAKEYYDYILSPSIELYKKYFFESTLGDKWGWVEPASIQFYKPGGGFKDWHCERNCMVETALKRKLVFMTYLWDVEDQEEFQGGTEWLYQGLKLKAKRGHTVIWPADWTHTHRGIISPNKEKMIITGWLSYYKDYIRL